MTTKVTTIIDQLNSICATLYPNRTLLFDPSIIENNDTMFLLSGYGITPLEATNSERALSCMFSMDRNFMLTLTEAVRGTQRDTASRSTTIKTLLEAQYSFINEFESNQQLATISPKKLILSDGGIENVVGEEKNILMLQTTFSIEYFEDLT